MKKTALILLFTFIICITTTIEINAQCAICTKTAQQLGEKPAQGLNQGILYLMFMPFALVGIIGYKWWRSNREEL